MSAKRKVCGVSERGAAARERRVAMRTRLREMKMAAKAAAATTTEREEQEGEGVTEGEEEKEGEGVKVSGEIVAVQQKENTNSVSVYSYSCFLSPLLDSFTFSLTQLLVRLHPLLPMTTVPLGTPVVIAVPRERVRVRLGGGVDDQ